MKRTFSLFLFIPFLFSAPARAQYYQKIVTYAGTGVAGYSGDGYPATAGEINGPLCVALDNSRNLYICDYYNGRIRKVKSDNGTIVTFAGNGVPGYTGDGSAATSANVNPHGIAADYKGNVFLSDASNNVIRRISNMGIISTYAGTTVPGYSGDNGAALSAKLCKPYGMATDSRGDLYFADAGNNAVRMIDTNGIISTIAGIGTPGYSGDGSVAVMAQLDSPYAVAVDRFHNVYIADRNNNVVRMVDASGVISTLAGTGTFGYTGDGASAQLATLHYPTGVACDTAGNVYIADSYNNVVRMVNASTQVITTVAGNGYAGFGGDLGYATGANLFHPFSVAVDSAGSIYIADANNQRVRQVYNMLTLGVGQVSGNSGISVYPDPAQHSITVAGLKAGDKVCVSDISGRMVSAMLTALNDGPAAMALDNLAPGNYLLQVWNENNVKKDIIKIVKR